MQGWLIVNENFGNFTFTVQCVTNCSILVALIFSKVRIAVFFSSVSSTLHHFFNVDACSSDWKKTNSSQNRVTSAYIIRNNKCFVSFFIRKLLQSAFLAVCRSVNTFTSFFFAVLLLKSGAENTESNRWLCSGTGFRDNVH
ncbi:hypothetical protein D3C76_1183730 [compost metagenome]